MASTSNPQRLHWLPCSISHDGPAPVSEYFKPTATGELITRAAEEKTKIDGIKKNSHRTDKEDEFRSAHTRSLLDLQSPINHSRDDLW